MAVRFLPSDEEAAESAPQRENLAEVIELRSLLANSDAPTPAAQSQDEPDIAAEATRLLARKAMSSGELRAALGSRGYDAGEVDEVIADFEASLYLDDAGLARSVTEKLRSSKRASRSQIRVKLRERKLPDAVIEQMIAELSDDEELELLRAAAEDRARRLAGLDRQTAQRRLLGYLQRRGWQGEAAYRIVDEVLAS